MHSHTYAKQYTHTHTHIRHANTHTQTNTQHRLLPASIKVRSEYRWDLCVCMCIREFLLSRACVMRCFGLVWARGHSKRTVSLKTSLLGCCAVTHLNKAFAVDPITKRTGCSLNWLYNEESPFLMKHVPRYSRDSRNTRIYKFLESQGSRPEKP